MAPLHYRAGIIGLGMIGGADPVSARGTWAKRRRHGRHAFLAPSPAIPAYRSSLGAAGTKAGDGAFEERSGVKTYAAWRDMLEREALDLISVATYAPGARRDRRGVRGAWQSR